MNQAVFVDRDGVINRALVRDGRPSPPRSLDELEILPGVPEAVRALRAGGYRVIVVTNQPDVGAGQLRQDVVEAINGRIRAVVPVDDIKVCYHVDGDACRCRKPKPGMLLEAAREWALDLERSFMVGDRWRDIEAGRAAGCRTILVEADYTERRPDRPDGVVRSLVEASGLILSGALGGWRDTGEP